MGELLLKIALFDERTSRRVFYYGERDLVCLSRFRRQIAR
jgi:hypothetical protein